MPLKRKLHVQQPQVIHYNNINEMGIRDIVLIVILLPSFKIPEDAVKINFLSTTIPI